MAFPPEVVGPVCDAFLKRTELLLESPNTAISKIHYGVLSLQLLVEKKHQDAVFLAMSRKDSPFVRAAFKFILSSTTSK